MCLKIKNFGIVLWFRSTLNQQLRTRMQTLKAELDNPLTQAEANAAKLYVYTHIFLIPD